MLYKKATWMHSQNKFRMTLLISRVYAHAVTLDNVFFFAYGIHILKESLLIIETFSLFKFRIILRVPSINPES